jgi:hypothetical protein
MEGFPSQPRYVKPRATRYVTVCQELAAVFRERLAGAPIGCPWGMANGAPAWLIAVPCRRSEALHDPASHDANIRDLTPRSRRELLLLVAVALSSTTAVLVVDGGLVPPGPPIDSAPIAIQALAAPTVPLPLPISAPATRTVRRNPTTSSAAVAVKASNRNPMVLASSKLAVEKVPSSELGVAMQMVGVELASTEARKRPGAVKRVLFGSGQYRVQPFPTISEQN